VPRSQRRKPVGVAAWKTAAREPFRDVLSQAAITAAMPFRETGE